MDENLIAEQLLQLAKALAREEEGDPEPVEEVEMKRRKKKALDLQQAIFTEFVRGGITSFASRGDQFNDQTNELYKLVSQKDSKNNFAIFGIASDMMQNLDQMKRQLRKTQAALEMITEMAK